MGDDKEQIRVVSAEIRSGGRYLVTQRPEHAVLPHLWEFPGGKVRRGESDQDCLVRVIEGRIGVVVEPGEKLFEVTHSYDAYDIVLAVYSCDLAGAEPRALSVAQVAWLSSEEFSSYEFPGADQKTVELLLNDD